MSKSEHDPPIWLSRLLERVIEEYYLDAIYGDLCEEFEHNLNKSGVTYAKAMFIFGGLGFIVKGVKRKRTQNNTSMITALLSTFLKSTWRYFQKRKAYVSLNILGLAVGFASALAIWKYVAHETSYDEFHQDGIFRVISTSEGSTGMANSTPDLAPLLRENFASIKTATHFFPRRKGALRVSENGEVTTFRGIDFLYSDEQFFKIFANWDRTDLSAALEQPNTTVITESLSRKLFKTTNAVGKTISFKDTNFPLIDYSVSAVIPDPPGNSHFTYDAIVSLNTIVRNGKTLDQMGWNGFYTYILAHDPLAEAEIRNQLHSYSSQYFEELGSPLLLDIQPIKDIHLHSNLNNDMGADGDIQIVKYFTLAAIFILLMAYVNFINLATAQSLDRAKEIGLRKVLGSRNVWIRYQIAVETAIQHLISIGLGLVILFGVARFLPDTLELNKLVDFSLYEILFFIGMVMVCAILSGIYPSHILARFKPISVLRGKIGLSSGTIGARSVLTIVQFSISALMLIVTLVVSSQLDYMLSYNKGVDIENILIVKPPQIKDEQFRNQVAVFKNNVSELPFVSSMSTASTTPGLGYNYSTQASLLSGREEEPIMVFTDGIDESFIDHYQLKLLSGTSFSEGMANKRGKALINKTALHLFNIDNAQDALSEKIIMERDTLEIMGVLDNYHHRDLSKDYDAQVLCYYGSHVPHFSIRLNAANTKELISNLQIIEDVYTQTFNGNTPEYFFVDDKFDQQYRQDRLANQVSGYFTTVSLIIAMIGLIGFISYMLSTKQKEIALKRVLGAAKSNILKDLSMPILKMILAAGVVSMALGFLFARSWLDQYAFRMSISVIHLIAPVFAIILISLMILLIRSLRTLSENPIRWIRNE